MSIKRLANASITGSGGKSSKLWDQTTTMGTYESIATAVVDAAGASSITFSNIPQNYQHLQLRMTARSDRATYAHDNFRIVVGNGSIDNGSNYSWHSLQSEYVSGYTNVYSYSGTTATSMNLIGTLSSTTGNGEFAGGIIDFLDYTNTNKFKTVRALSGADNNGATAGYITFVTFGSGLWQSTSAVNTISLQPSGGGSNFTQYSTAALYGIRGA